METTTYSISEVWAKGEQQHSISYEHVNPDMYSEAGQRLEAMGFRLQSRLVEKLGGDKAA